MASEWGSLSHSFLIEALFRNSYVENGVMPHCAEVSSGSLYNVPGLKHSKED